MKKNFVLLLLFWTQLAFAQTTLKVGVLAPDGTTWANTLKDIAKEIDSATKGNVKLKIYFGGVLGDEPDVLRKIRIGQVQGGVFTGRALGDINGDVRSIELPFNFRENREKALHSVNQLASYFNEGFVKHGFKNLGFFEIGNVYVVSTQKATSIEELSKLKIWSWEGDKIVESLLRTMNFVSVPLALPDVLSSLQTGIITAAYASPLGIIALQWHTKIKYLIDFPVSYSVGAFLVDMKSWSKISPENQKIVEAISTKYVKMANEQTVKENQIALDTLKSMGVEFVPFPAADAAKGNEIRQKIITDLQFKVFSKDALSKVNGLL